MIVLLKQKMIPEKFHYYLLALAKAHTAEQRRRLIIAADPQIIELICEIAFNLIRGNIEVTEHQMKQLSPHRAILRKLVKKNISLQRKKHILANQRGGFLPFLIPIISSLAGGLLGKIFNK